MQIWAWDIRAVEGGWGNGKIGFIPNKNQISHSAGKQHHRTFVWKKLIEKKMLMLFKTYLFHMITYASVDGDKQQNWIWRCWKRPNRKSWDKLQFSLLHKQMPNQQGSQDEHHRVTSLTAKQDSAGHGNQIILTPNFRWRWKITSRKPQKWIDRN